MASNNRRPFEIVNDRIDKAMAIGHHALHGHDLEGYWESKPNNQTGHDDWKIVRTCCKKRKNNA